MHSACICAFVQADVAGRKHQAVTVFQQIASTGFDATIKDGAAHVLSQIQDL